MRDEGPIRRARLRGVFWAIAPVVVCVVLAYFMWPCLRFLLHAPAIDSFFDPSVAAFNPAPTPFDQAKWDRGHATDRIAMGKWMADNGTLNGLKRAELVAQLGPFDYEGTHEGKTQLTWYLGDLDDGGMFIRHMKLLVKIAPTGIVVDAYIYSTD